MPACRPPSRGIGMNSAGSDSAQTAGGRNNGKGLRHFSMKVCEKVESKGRTTYNEVADELVGEFSGAAHLPPPVALRCARSQLPRRGLAATLTPTGCMSSQPEACREPIWDCCCVTWQFEWQIRIPSILPGPAFRGRLWSTWHEGTAHPVHAHLCIADFETTTLSPACAGSPGIAAYDEKNIRRRVYDALNVLMAMDIIIKDKKDISWKGLPSAPHAQLEKLKDERAALRQKILNQQAYLQASISPSLCHRCTTPNLGVPAARPLSPSCHNKVPCARRLLSSRPTSRQVFFHPCAPGAYPQSWAFLPQGWQCATFELRTGCVLIAQ